MSDDENDFTMDADDDEYDLVSSITCVTMTCVNIKSVLSGILGRQQL